MNNTRKDKELSIGDHFTFSANHSESVSSFKDCCISWYYISWWYHLPGQCTATETAQENTGYNHKTCEVQLREKHRSAPGAKQSHAYIQATKPLSVWQPH